MDVRMDGRVALITGGSRGLGRAMALKFAEAGADVAIVARRPDMLEKTRADIAGRVQARIQGYSCDVSDAGQIETMFEAVIADFGKVDILVNNAGSSVTGPFEEVSDEVWQADEFERDLRVVAIQAFDADAQLVAGDERIDAAAEHDIRSVEPDRERAGRPSARAGDRECGE